MRCTVCDKLGKEICRKCADYNPDMGASYFNLKPDIDLNSLLTEVMIKRLDLREFEWIVKSYQYIYLEVIQNFRNLDNLQKTITSYLGEKNHD